MVFPLKRTLTSSWAHPHLILVTSQKPHLLIPSHWRLGFQYINSGRTLTFSPQQRTNTNKYADAFAACCDVSNKILCLWPRSLLFVSMFYLLRFQVRNNCRSFTVLDNHSTWDFFQSSLWQYALFLALCECWLLFPPILSGVFFPLSLVNFLICMF